MTRDFHPVEPRSRVIARYCDAAVRGGLPLCKLAMHIAERYMAMTAPHERVVAFYSTGGGTTRELTRAEASNAQLVTRFLRGTVKLPVDLEESIVGALPEPHQSECARELAKRYGFLGAREPNIAANPVSDLSRMTREFSDTLEALAPILADGRIDVADAPHLKRALKESGELLGEIVGLQAQLTAALPEVDAKVVGLRTRAG